MDVTLFHQKTNAMNYKQVNSMYESLCDKYEQVRESTTDSKKIDKLTDISERLIVIERYLPSLEIIIHLIKEVEKDLNTL